MTDTHISQEKVSLISAIENQLKTVYDPEFPLVDIFTLGLIYTIDVDLIEEKAKVVMTFTTPACPMADMLIAMVKNATQEVVPTYEIDVEITFEPFWSPKMIKDQDLQRMFE